MNWKLLPGGTLNGATQRFYESLGGNAEKVCKRLIEDPGVRFRLESFLKDEEDPNWDGMMLDGKTDCGSPVIGFILLRSLNGDEWIRMFKSLDIGMSDSARGILKNEFCRGDRLKNSRRYTVAIKNFDSGGTTKQIKEAIVREHGFDALENTRGEIACVLAQGRKTLQKILGGFGIKNIIVFHDYRNPQYPDIESYLSISLEDTTPTLKTLEGRVNRATWPGGYSYAVLTSMKNLV